MTEMTLNRLSATDAAQGIRDGAFSSEALVKACLLAVDAREADVQAWAYLDPEHAMTQARRSDEARSAGAPLGPLHGVPVGLKDIIDTRDMPTEDGTPLHAGRMPSEDASVVSRLRCAGAIIMGKTVTSELATFSPGKTRNPNNPQHTPGGSSSGSAAAVAADMVPLALGTQTNGSVIRPAAFCGVVGYKPSKGLVSRHGILRSSRTLDQVGVFARTVEDAALLTQVLSGYDEQDGDTAQRACPPLQRVCGDAPPLPPKFGFVRTPFWDEMDADAREGMLEVQAFLGKATAEYLLPPVTAKALEWHRRIMEADLAANYAEDFERGAARMSESLRGQIERGRQVLAVEYLDAVARINVVRESFDDAFDHYDVLLSPAALGTAPPGLGATGNPLMSTLWTFCGMPAITLPLLTGENGLPIGVQLIARLGDDARLLRTARWLMSEVRAEVTA